MPRLSAPFLGSLLPSVASGSCRALLAQMASWQALAAQAILRVAGTVLSPPNRVGCIWMCFLVGPKVRVLAMMPWAGVEGTAG